MKIGKYTFGFVNISMNSIPNCWSTSKNYKWLYKAFEPSFFFGKIGVGLIFSCYLTIPYWFQHNKTWRESKKAMEEFEKIKNKITQEKIDKGEIV